MLPGRGLCDELIARPEESYRLCCVVVCDLETSRMGAPYIYDISRLRVNNSVILVMALRYPVWCVGFVFVCSNRIPEDGIPVPKYLGVRDLS